MKKILVLAVLFTSILTYAVNTNEPPSESTQEFCYEYALNMAGGSYEVFGDAYDDCCGVE